LGYTVFGLGRTELDITNEYGVNRKVTDLKPDIIIHCAAYINVDKAESEQDLPFLINRVGTRNIVLASKSIKQNLSISVQTMFLMVHLLHTIMNFLQDPLLMCMHNLN
jgi:dTDP-4-dehydrorhamnose reductase